MSCGQLVRLGDRAVGGAQVWPIDVGPQLLAADGAVRELFNLDDMLERHAAFCPLADGARRNAECAGQCFLASEDFAGVFDCVHAA